MTPYREMEAGEPRREVGWRRALRNAAWPLAAVVTSALCSFGVRECNAIEKAEAEAVRQAEEHTLAQKRMDDERAATQRRGRIAACVARGGTWSEGTIDGRPAEWCSWRQR